MSKIYRNPKIVEDSQVGKIQNDDNIKNYSIGCN